METVNVKYPSSLIEAIETFSDPRICLDVVAGAKWGSVGPICPACTSQRLSFLQTRLMWKCLDCKKQFTVKVGTIFEDSPIPLKKWLCAMWLLANCKNGVSSYEIARDLKVTQTTAWFMLQRLRYTMHTGSINKMTGEVEADETHIGGKARFMHKDKRDKMRGRSNFGKAIVLGLLERETGQVRTAVVPDRSKEVLQGAIRRNVRKRAHLMTDEHLAYDGLGSDYTHKVINHAESYVEGNVHTNRMENFWSLLKRTIKGTYVSVEPFHLFRYLDEQSFRYNERKLTDAERFAKVLGAISGKRLTYARVKG
jgi:transposase-like protein